MKHPFDTLEPVTINHVLPTKEFKHGNILEIATTNQNKLTEFKRLLPEYKVLGIDINVEEIQSMNPHKVAEHKAKDAWEANNYNPILVEDTSVEINGLGGLPGPLLTFFVSEVLMRKAISETWLEGADRRATARTILSIYDGKETQIFEGIIKGHIAKTTLGGGNFGFDDIFIPDGQSGSKLTYAQMGPHQKDKFSMRSKAVDEFRKAKLRLNEWIYGLPEPFDSELIRIDYKALGKPKALKFAFSLEGLEKVNKPNRKLQAPVFSPIAKKENQFYKRYLTDPDSNSIGVIVTDVDRAKSMIHRNGEPVLWQMSSRRRTLALAQRADFFLKITDKKVLNTIKQIDSGQIVIPHRNNKSHASVEKALGMTKENKTIEARSLKELGYKKISAGKYVSRSESAQYGLFNKIGKYTRSYLSLGSLPACSGWRDAIVMSALANMATFVPRNNIFAKNTDQQIKLVKDAQKIIKSLRLPKGHQEMALRNIGVAIGANPKTDTEEALRLYKEAGIKLFRIYTINGDPRVLETAVKVRSLLGNKIELFVGQISDSIQAKQLIDWAKADALIFGHGGGRQCTSATNGMAISAVEDLYEIVANPHFNNTTILQEGGVGRNIGPLLVLGVDGVLYNQQLTRGTIETGGLFLQDKNGAFGQPYHGSASAPTMIIESANPGINRLNASGRTKVPEGKPGFTKFTFKTNSMAFWIDEFRHHLARTLADLGVCSIAELREMLAKDDREFLRIVSQEASNVAQAYKS